MADSTFNTVNPLLKAIDLGDGTYAMGVRLLSGAGIPIPGVGALDATAWVIGSDASTEIKNFAAILQAAGFLAWVCDGVDDDVELLAGINSLSAGQSIKAVGTFYLSTGITCSTSGAQLDFREAILVYPGTAAAVSLVCSGGLDIKAKFGEIQATGSATTSPTAIGLYLSGIAFSKIKAYVRNFNEGTGIELYTHGAGSTIAFNEFDFHVRPAHISVKFSGDYINIFNDFGKLWCFIYGDGDYGVSDETTGTYARENTFRNVYIEDPTYSRTGVTGMLLQGKNNKIGRFGWEVPSIPANISIQSTEDLIIEHIPPAALSIADIPQTSRVLSQNLFKSIVTSIEPRDIVLDDATLNLVSRDGSGNRITDLSGKGDHATLYNSPIWGIIADSGWGCLTLDGSTQYGLTPSVEGFDGDVTVIWAGVMRHNYDDGVIRHLWGVDTTGGYLFRLYNRNDSQLFVQAHSLIMSFADAFSSGDKRVYIVTRKNSTDEVILYINGANVVSSTTSHTLASAGPIYLGRNPLSASNYGKFSLGLFAIVPRVMNPTEVDKITQEIQQKILGLSFQSGDIRSITKSIDHADLTDGGGATGYIDFDDQIPAGSIVKAVKCDFTEAWTSDNTTTLTMMIGLQADLDAFNKTADPGENAFNHTTDVFWGETACQEPVVTSAATPRVTFTEDDDITHIISGAGAQGKVIITITYMKA